MKRTRKYIIDSDTSDCELEFLVPNKKHRHETAFKPRSDKFLELEKQIETELENREITIQQVYELQLSIDDYIWFTKYIKIRDNTENNTEERFNLTDTIYQKYIRLKDTDHKKLEELKNNSNSEISIVKRILNSNHNDYTKSLVYKKYKLFCENNNSYSEEYSKCIEWIDTVLDIPVSTKSFLLDSNSQNKSKIITSVLTKLNNFLSEKIYGLDEVKEKIMEAMCCKILNPLETSGKIITLVGPPGVGKTSIASTIAEAMDMPFDQISFGSIQDSKILTGHSSTYVGAVPGIFTKILIKAKRLDAVILLDEIDKITNTQDSNITSVLFHVLDKSQNNRFKDIYVTEIPLDLSKIIFLCAANDINKIDPVLKDRMTIINLNGYSIADKTNIAETFLVPKFMKDLNFEKDEITIDRKTLEYIISKKTKDQPGMRDTERKLRELFERIALLKYSKDIDYSFAVKNLKFPLKVTESIINGILK
jgi:ATP-dependent Lon protease